jgi:hypothetical protein
MARNAKRVAVLAAAVGGLGLIFAGSHTAEASILGTLYPSLPIDTIYGDNFTGTGGTGIVGNNPTTETGLDGGSATAPWAGDTVIGTPSAGSDALWQYSGSSSASITSPTANIATSGNTGEDASTIVNMALPFSPGVGLVYDLEATFMVPAATGAHGLEMAYLWNNGNGHITADQAISNNDPAGLILDRDAVSGGGYFDVFEGTGTSGDTHFAPTASALTGGSVGTSVTVDEIYTPTGATTGTMSWYLQGQLVNVTPVSLSGMTGGISWIQLGDNRTTGDTITSFSLTAVPEPTVIGLLIGGAFPLMLRRRNRKPG